jgi:hypothetical protein
LQSQLAQIAGSLAVLGSPLGFARKVGHGVKAFFYEPYHGLVQSPHEFVLGIRKGQSSLTMIRIIFLYQGVNLWHLGQQL